ncbi:hypothetical protein Drose_05870 [Dactylosporangium roseum]|uniref:Uncharacterized protein n=1 Tax=Dactylosporangium roseum TaxID=47989 RepID=A0ABY5Z9X1_9ACTN|nr:hypothetical protein [Dactylosporangium roseum]UWZ37798.1 hypothetical protein Drose_05870 [Dactylosporangium roseum]
MKAAFAAEAIGLRPADDRLYRQLGIRGEMHRARRPWVARLEGLCPVYGYRREFLDPDIDYTDANGNGSRGVVFRWVLESGRFYETRYPVSWSRMGHRFLTATPEGDVVDVTEAQIRARWEEEEVRRRWANEASGLTF